jgi:hypothetical protein
LYAILESYVAVSLLCNITNNTTMESRNHFKNGAETEKPYE